MDTRHYWEENGQLVNKYDNYNGAEESFVRVGGELNFAAHSDDEADFPPGAFLKKGKVSRQDPMSHRIIEKRRRDRMNNCLADLSRLIPPEYLKKGRGRVEKTEIIEMAIRHLKYLQERVNAAERQGEEFRAGYQQASREAVRYLVELQGYAPTDGLCVQMTAHLHRHCELHAPGNAVMREKLLRPLATSSSETASSSCGSRGGYKPGVITSAPPGPPGYPDQYSEPERPPLEQSYSMDCDLVSNQMSGPTESEQLDNEPLNLDGRRKDLNLRDIRKPDHMDDYIHSYKFKNSIERRFSRSLDTEAPLAPEIGESEHFPAINGKVGPRSLMILADTVEAEALTRAAHAAAVVEAGKALGLKRRREVAAATPISSNTTSSNSGSNEDARDVSPQDTSSESLHHHYDKAPQSQLVPIFALNAYGKYYVPLSVEQSCLTRLAGARQLEALTPGGRAAVGATVGAPLHPVTIHVNFEPCDNYHVKREPSDRDWRPGN